MDIMAKELKLYFVRHGETQYNIEKRMQGSCNSPLTDKGVLQAKSVGAGLADIPFVTAYASDSQRVLDTANYAIGDRDIAINKDARLREMHFGILEEMLQEDILVKHGNILETFFSIADAESKLEEGESYTELLIRTKAAVQDIIEKHESTGGNILIFSHGITIGYYMKNVLNRKDFPHHDNCCVSVVNYQDGEITVEKLADASFKERGSALLSANNN